MIKICVFEKLIQPIPRAGFWWACVFTLLPSWPNCSSWHWQNEISPNQLSSIFRIWDIQRHNHMPCMKTHYKLSRRVPVLRRFRILAAMFENYLSMRRYSVVLKWDATYGHLLFCFCMWGRGHIKLRAVIWCTMRHTAGVGRTLMTHHKPQTLLPVEVN